MPEKKVTTTKSAVVTATAGRAKPAAVAMKVRSERAPALPGRASSGEAGEPSGERGKAAPKAQRAPKPAAKARAGKPTSAAAAAKPVVARRVVRKRVAALATPAVTRASHAWRKGPRKTKVGLVVSAKQALTVIVQVERLREHPLYKKVIRVRKRFAAHDAAGDVRAGDLVRIEEGRPYSATKRWRVVEVLSRAGEAGAAAPKVADIEAALEASEGSKDALVHVAPSSVAKSEETNQ